MSAPGNPDRISPVWLTNIDPTGALRRLSSASEWIGKLEIVGGLITDDLLPEEALDADWNVIAEDMQAGRLLVARWALAATLPEAPRTTRGLQNFRAVDRLSSGPDAALAVPRSRAEYTDFGKANPLAELGGAA